jgi:hypothetical protein
MPGTIQIIGQYTCILRNNAQEATAKRLGFKCDTNKIRKYFLFELRFEPWNDRMNDGHLSHLCHATAHRLAHMFKEQLIC